LPCAVRHNASADARTFNDELPGRDPRGRSGRSRGFESPVSDSITRQARRWRKPGSLAVSASLAGSVSGSTNRGALSLDTFRYVSRHRDRTNHLGLALDDRESHLDV
jgi:hypothetical protein